jgi:hypothetical protein
MSGPSGEGVRTWTPGCSNGRLRLMGVSLPSRFRDADEVPEEVAMSLSFSLESLALMVEEVFPDIAAQGFEDLEGLGRCAECGSDLYTEGCPACVDPTEY